MYFINWKSYFQDNQKEEYNLKETEEIKLFNTNDISMQGDYQLNYLNKYLGELVMMYYIWKNNLKSDYICISQYRKDFSYINFKELSNNKIQLWHCWQSVEYYPMNILFDDEHHIDPTNYLKTKFEEYLDIQTTYNSEQINKIKSCPSSRRFAIFVFAMKWEIFCEICHFIFGFLDYLFPNNSWQNPKNIIHLRDKQYDKYIECGYPKFMDDWNWNMLKDNRYIVFVIEKILSVCLLSLYDYCYDKSYIYQDFNIVSESNDINEIVKFYVKNKKINNEYTFIKVNNEKYNEINSFFEKCNYAFPNIKIINDYNNIIDKPYIKLNINEYIDSDNYYTIKNMSIEEIKKYIKVII